MNIRTFSQLVSDGLNAFKSSLGLALDSAIGAVTIALMEANAGIVVWLESLVLQVLAWARAQTSCGTALDNWMAQFNFPRLPGTAATGSVTFGAITAPTNPVTIPSGTLVQTATGIQYATTQAATLAAGQTSVIVPVVCTQPLATGALGNTGAGTISQLAQSVPGIDTVTNASAISNGFNAEQDSAYRARFIVYIGGLGQGTVLAITSAVLNYGQGYQFSIVEGAVGSGVVNVYLGNGTLAGVSSTVLSSIGNAVNGVRAAGVAVYVNQATTVSAAINAVITLAPGYTSGNVTPLIQSAIDAFIALIKMGGTLPYSQLYALIYGASPGIINVTGLTLNGATADLVAASNEELVAGTIMPSYA